MRDEFEKAFPVPEHMAWDSGKNTYHMRMAVEPDDFRAHSALWYYGAWQAWQAATDAALADRDAKITAATEQLATLQASNEALTARIAALEGSAPNAGQWQAGYVASQANAAPATDQYAQPQNGIDQSWLGLMSGGLK